MECSLAFLVLALASVASCVPTKGEREKVSLDSVSSAMYKQLSKKNQGKNLVMSPLSVQVALSAISVGSEGEISNELRSVFSDLDKYSVNRTLKEYNEVDSVYEDKHGRTDPERPVLILRNKIYHEQSPKVKKNFKFDMENLNLRKTAEATNAINEWVAAETKGQIKDVIASGSLNKDTTALLISTLYFKAAWKHAFNPLETTEAQFFLHDSTPVDAAMMRIDAFYQYGEFRELDARVIQLPFNKDDMSMVLVVPNKANGLKSIEGQLASANIQNLLNQTIRNYMNLSLPKFRIRTHVYLKKILPSIGVTELFAKDGESKELRLSDARQKAVIEINEFGCDADEARFTSYGVMTRQLTLNVNVPFYFAVIDKHYNRILSGRVVDPSVYLL